MKRAIPSYTKQQVQTLIDAQRPTRALHTPGPWKVGFTQIPATPVIAYTIENERAEDGTAEHNTALIAAAIEMFEAIENYLKTAADGECTIPELEICQYKLRTAIAKARGGES